MMRVFPGSSFSLKHSRDWNEIPSRGQLPKVVIGRADKQRNDDLDHWADRIATDGNTGP